MSLSNIANKPAAEPIPIGTYAARLIGIIELGKQTNTYQGKTSVYEKVMLMFEFPQTGEYEGKKFNKTLVTEMACSVRAIPKPTKLYQVFNAIDARADARNAKNFLGKYLFAQVGRTSGDKAKVVNFVPLPAGMPVHDSAANLLFFDLAEPSMEVYKTLPKFVQDKIREAVDYAGSELETEINKLPLDTNEVDTTSRII